MRLLYKSGPMESLRKWFYKPKRDDSSLLAQFFFADDALNLIAAELDSFDGRKDPERCSTLVNQLRHAQDRVLNITSQIMDQVLGDERVARGFRVKFPEDVLQDNLAGQLWFGAECLAAGSSIMNREEESAAMRPLAKALTRSLETVRSLLREQCLRPRGLALQDHDDMLHESLRIFDRLFAEFELCYVSAMVNVKTPHEFEAQQLICVLFSESLRRALKQSLLTQEQVDSYDPALMFAVPRLAIVSGLLIYSSGPLSIDKPPEEMSDMFRPFRTLLHKIRSLLWTLDRRELLVLERLLCTNEDVSSLAGLDIPADDSTADSCYPDIGEFVSKFYADNVHCRDLYTQSSSEHLITDADYLPDNIEVMTPIIEGLKRLRRHREADKKNTLEGTNEPNCSTSTRRKRKSSTKKKKKKMWSPGIVILDNRSNQNQSPLRLNLDHFVENTSCSTSECADDEQIALALQAQELAARRRARDKFKSSEDLIHRLFVCIAGVADQLQTNFAADLRNILKAVFLMNQTAEVPESIEYQAGEDQVIQNGSSFDSVYSAEEVYADSNSDSTSEPSRVARRNTVNSTMNEPNVSDRRKSADTMQASVSTGDLTYRDDTSSSSVVERAPEWVPDIAAPACMRCSSHFTAFRRRHHCRNCGKVFCASCSSNSIPLPRFGQLKPVRVCEECYQTNCGRQTNR
ncbi:unnamed protein product [Danaus chrysippus]|uniref:Lateral signaling target protein 2 homolog n=1 Tax=Danaus chrysippus TaxID=151541 RepID=A0A8J2W6G9_9NEOP|nr:unnamed protein product [Danaus chrysippus]